jgi:hypothetical protein
MLAFDSSTVLAISAIITIFVTLLIAVFNFFAVLAMRRQGSTLSAQADVMLQQANIMLKETKASVLQKCTESYIIIRRQKSKAVMEKSLEIAKDYYREICDLHWSEFRLYSEDLITESTMKAWLGARARNYSNDKIEFKDIMGNVITVKYADVWKELLKDGYFLEGDPFILFMNTVHEGRLDDALRYRI